MQLPELEPSQLTRAKWQVTRAEEHVFCIFHQITGTIQCPVWTTIRGCVSL